MSNPELRRAAIILLSLPESEAALLLSRLDPKQVEAVAAEMAGLGRLPSIEQAQKLQLFAAVKQDPLPLETRGLSATQRILEQALGSRAAEMMAVVRQRLEQTTFDFLEEVDDQIILAVLRPESLQTVTLVLAHLPVRRAARLLQALPNDWQGAIVRRIAALRPVDAEVLALLKQAVQRQLGQLTSAGSPDTAKLVA